jgi:putative peptidoglycan lipid II flippase
VSDQKLIKSVGKVGIAVMISRVLGLIRDQVFAGCFGTGWLNDAYFMAFRIPNLLRDLFAEGALSSAFVTVFARKKAEDGDEGAWRLARIVMTLQTLFVGGLTIIGICLAPQLVHLMAPDFEKITGKTELTIMLVRILFPFILFVGMAALSMGVLNTYGRFGLPASASSFFNLGSIIVGVGLAWIFDPHFGQKGIICMAIGTLAGGIIQWFVMVPSLKGLGYRFFPDFSFKDPAVIEIIKLIGPAIIGVSAIQINVMINSIFASGFEGGVAKLQFAFRLIQLPIGLFGVSISTATLPSLAVDASNFNRDAFRKRIEQALRLNTTLCLPAACGLAALSVPIIGLLFQRGKFDLSDTMSTARILIAYSIGLVGYSSIKILSPAFYALNRVVTPMYASFGTIIVTYLLNWFFIHQTKLGPSGLALTTSITALFGCGVLLAVLSRLIGGISPEAWKAVLKIVFSSAMMTVAVVCSNLVNNRLGISYEFRGYLTRVITGIPLGILVFVAVARFMKLEEIDTAKQIITNKLFRSSKAKH